MPSVTRRLARTSAAAILGLAALIIAADYAEARRAGSGGGFGSRGSRTHEAAPATQTAPAPAAPIERSMTPNTGPAAPAMNQTNRPGAQAQTPAAAQKPGLFGSFGRSMLGGLLVGGLIGMLLGQGFGGLAGFFGLLLQVGLIALIVFVVMRLIASRRQQAPAPAHAYSMPGASPTPMGGGLGQGAPGAMGGMGGMSGHGPAGAGQPGQSGLAGLAGGLFSGGRPAQPQPVGQPIQLDGSDFDRFEQMLTEVQEAYGREDFGALRRLATPEAMSYLAEELGELATEGRRNSVTAVKLLQGDLAEAWTEDGTDYATVAMRYEAIDVMLDRDSGAVIEGNPEVPGESIELWTFARKQGGEWKLSAIQGVQA
ncbi:Tim44 domain-containing protein [Pannonibacter tanglangensis]|uniref:TIM44-like domain-containing protein n=1 Tax=Pannonibacter tanglangensis TaxID=2750084 RepID=A0ABW9ZI87_9HYPH|nr:Tim44 domain-containing protein [Pannonibacter sp. XCT-34]NBN62430.1 TIM44-like domain-containing protein [Pannonibacter sp. XCT-34]